MTQATDIAALKAWRTAHDKLHAASPLHASAHTHDAPAPAPPPVIDWQAVINAAAPGSTLDFTGTSYAKALVIPPGITTIGGDLDGKNAIAQGVTITGADVTIRGMKVHDCTYAGIMVLSGLRVWVDGCTVERIGKVAYDAAVAAGGGPAINAYGIAVSRTTGPQSADCKVTGNTVDWVPSWEGIDAHGGSNLVIADNIVRHCNRAIRLTDSGGSRPQNTRLDRNTMTDPTRRQDVLTQYPYNQVALTAIGCDGVTGSGNTAPGWPTKLDKGTSSTGVTVTVS